jgi:hypothetical protein
MQFVIPLVSPEILRAWQLLAEYVEDREEHVRRDVLVDSLEFLEVNLRFALEADVKDFKHFMQSLDALVEVRGATPFLGKLAFTKNWSRFGNRHVAENSGDVLLGDQAVAIKVVNFEDELRPLLKGGAVDPQKTCQEFPVVNIAIVVQVHHLEKPLPKHPRQSRVLGKN